MEKCNTCKWWDQKFGDAEAHKIPAADKGARLCRRFPTEVYKYPHEWCGEHAAK